MILGGFPDDYDWHAHDKRKHAQRMALDARWRLLRDYFPAIQRLAHGPAVIPLDQFVLQFCAHVVLEELAADIAETAELQFRHQDRPEPPAPPPEPPPPPAPTEPPA